MPPLPPSLDSRRCAQGFTLVELLVAATLGSVVLVGAGFLLLSIMRSSARSERVIQLRDDWARVSEFMEEEVTQGERVITDLNRINTLRGNLACTLNTAANVRFGVLAPHSQIPIVYGIRPPAGTEVNQWRGPNVIVRCGPTVAANGQLDPNTYREDVLAGAASELTAALITTDTNTATRAIRITLGFQTPGGTAYSNSFRDRDRVNPPYNLLDDRDARGINVCSLPNVYCGGGTLTGSATPNAQPNQYIPQSGAIVQGAPGREDIVYFEGPAPSGISNCMRSSCTISGVTMRDVEVVVFDDREIRM
ncbi:prepilin-type N-terminal cleavage/methylation domain-containing protein [Synechococcus sp. CBW1107]|uniref:PulJ/GspJ family protein n=1 Tax=Synechococcus sp. CBW1107 TaxID=2789857 RepID=UPI0018CFE219|nr:prepilin-type N-terminal cleavage/methylation domain-containing protein [Synechococcus sp. CBW1107]QPN55794.1 prepilin-type N-terminal cleavage/methylation domain-containing protein [Synechococcus sp. CBW1107]